MLPDLDAEAPSSVPTGAAAATAFWRTDSLVRARGANSSICSVSAACERGQCAVATPESDGLAGSSFWSNRAEIRALELARARSQERQRRDACWQPHHGRETSASVRQFDSLVPPGPGWLNSTNAIASLGATRGLGQMRAIRPQREPGHGRRRSCFRLRISRIGAQGLRRHGLWRRTARRRRGARYPPANAAAVLLVERKRRSAQTRVLFALSTSGC
jgi:hypothetical protein